ncbi:SDR family NAD(P)-dependent oxidoreductase, partial [Micromonospora sp. ATA32]|nr:SDR family NAD(P)-dependent oxidoreductase [Micromonospora sp. ATA32]
MSRVVVVSGATSGIGRACARAFAGRGNRLVLAARSPATLAEQVVFSPNPAGEAVRGGWLPD